MYFLIGNGTRNNINLTWIIFYVMKRYNLFTVLLNVFSLEESNLFILWL